MWILDVCKVWTLDITGVLRLEKLSYMLQKFDWDPPIFWATHQAYCFRPGTMWIFYQFSEHDYQKWNFLLLLLLVAVQKSRRLLQYKRFFHSVLGVNYLCLDSFSCRHGYYKVISTSYSTLLAWHGFKE